ncbi:PaaI family thioesterase [Haloechinothrix sp. YIM 98757]|uniref:Acyl-coenzyme A thioesterase THEM4 n=1 Tax=Haloechinothrix aidingensis TaxID=2752311 RepID=A0A838A6E3_9PSEU|nr:PaaI family thioesterase [Haloechinothrix aidingensis]MBA0124678.1 PaaI family thioesterase [Haloechinothrix aidingensis]
MTAQQPDYPRGSAPARLPLHSPRCMGCGPDNPAGLRMRAFRDGDEVNADVVFDEHHVGAPGLAHGGAVAAACDDLLGFALFVAETAAVTRSLSIEYLAPVPLHETHRITARIQAQDARRLNIAATGAGPDGTVRFTAEAVFIVVSLQHFLRHGDPDGVWRLLDRLTDGNADEALRTAAELPEHPQPGTEEGGWSS